MGPGGCCQLWPEKKKSCSTTTVGDRRLTSMYLACCRGAASVRYSVVTQQLERSAIAKNQGSFIKCMMLSGCEKAGV